MSEIKSTGAIKKKRDHKKQRRDSNCWENLIKSLEGLNEEDKQKAIEKKYRDLHANLMENQDTLKEYQRLIVNLEAEKNQLNREVAKTILGKTKFEAVARELQKQNKEIKEHNQMKLKEEEERRKLVASSFNEKLNTLNGLMDENRESSNRLKEENMTMRRKLQDLFVQFQQREQHVMDVNRQIELQTKLTETQFKKLELEFATEKDLWVKEKTLLVSKYERAEQTNKILETTVKSLQDHLDGYQKQFSEFENTISQSNKIYDNFKDDMVKLQKANKEFDKERTTWKANSQELVCSLIKLTDEKNQLVEDKTNLEKKQLTLEKLCRKLQHERAQCLKQLKAIGQGTELISDELVESLMKEKSFNEIASQTDFIEVIRRCPIMPPGLEPDQRVYINLEEGKLMRINLDMRYFHNKYINILQDMFKAQDKSNKAAKEKDTLIRSLRNLGPHDTEVILDFGLMQDGKVVSIVGNMSDVEIDQPPKRLRASIIQKLDGESEFSVQAAIPMKQIEEEEDK